MKKAIRITIEHNIVRKGQRPYPSVERFWVANIAPAEDRQIATWRQQVLQCASIDKLQELTRLSFPFSHLDVAAIALHLSGSGNTYPTGVYTGLFEKPNLACVVGHEGTHLTVDEYAGHNWHSHPLAATATEFVKGQGGTPADIEESLALIMRVKLSQACGYTSAARRISDSFDAKSTKGGQSCDFWRRAGINIKAISRKMSFTTC